MDSNWIFFNGEFIRREEAVLHISDLSIQRGYGVFDFFRTVNNIPLYIEDHISRFYYSAQKMRLTINLLPPELKDIIYQLVQKNDIPHSGIRISLTGGYSADGYSIAAPNLFITQQPFQPPAQKSIKLILHDYQRELSDVKTINYLMGIWLQPFIKEREADDVLYFKEGLIRECPRSNFFIVTKENVIATPASRILKGITRKKVLGVAKPYFKTEERDITIKDLQQAKEAFITSSTKRILPVVQINDLAYDSTGKDTIAYQLSQLLLAEEKDYITRHAL